MAFNYWIGNHIVYSFVLIFFVLYYCWKKVLYVGSEKHTVYCFCLFLNISSAKKKNKHELSLNIILLMLINYAFLDS